MHKIISSLFVIYALSAGALTYPTHIDSRSSEFGTHSQDVDRAIYIWDGGDCTPTYQWIEKYKLSWDLMQNLNTAAASFSVSRTPRTTEHLDWSSDVVGPPGANRIRAETILPGCGYFVKSTNLGPPGRDLPSVPLQGKHVLN